jgi:hypothetical protein
MKICFVGAELFIADSQTHSMKVMVALRNFSTASKNEKSADIKVVQTLPFRCCVLWHPVVCLSGNNIAEDCNSSVFIADAKFPNYE